MPVPAAARLDHVTIAVSDLPASLRFYDAVLGALGLRRLHELGDEEEDEAALEVAAYGAGDDDRSAQLWLVSRSDGAAGPAPVHLAFRADDAGQVERFHAAALAAGGTSHDAPRRWPIFRRGEFNAIVVDPDGNLVEAVGSE
jgi:catechol 2,3-dioxygenase-like lactoylglutathione lyase family enzyme